MPLSTGTTVLTNGHLDETASKKDRLGKQLDDLSSVTRTHIVREQTSASCDCLVSTVAHAHGHTHTHTHTQT